MIGNTNAQVSSGGGEDYKAQLAAIVGCDPNLSMGEIMLILEQERAKQVSYENRYLEQGDKLASNASIIEANQVLDNYDEGTYMNAFLNSIEVFPDKDYSINDTDGHIKGLRNYAFYGNTALKSLCLMGIDVIGNSAIYNCTNLEELKVCKISTYNSTGNGIFNCSNLKSLVLPCQSFTFGSATTGAFGTSSLENISLPVLSTALSIGGYWSVYLFSAYTSLKTFLINKATFENSRNYPFAASIEALIVTGNTVSTISAASFATTLATYNCYVYVPYDLLSTYQSATNWVTIHQSKTDEQGNYNGIQDIESHINDLRELGADFSFTPYANKKWENGTLVTDNTIGEEVDE